MRRRPGAPDGTHRVSDRLPFSSIVLSIAARQPTTASLKPKRSRAGAHAEPGAKFGGAPASPYSDDHVAHGRWLVDARLATVAAVGRWLNMHPKFAHNLFGARVNRTNVAARQVPGFPLELP